MGKYKDRQLDWINQRDLSVGHWLSWEGKTRAEVGSQRWVQVRPGSNSCCDDTGSLAYFVESIRPLRAKWRQSIVIFDTNDVEHVVLCIWDGDRPDLRLWRAHEQRAGRKEEKARSSPDHLDDKGIESTWHTIRVDDGLPHWQSVLDSVTFNSEAKSVNVTGTGGSAVSEWTERGEIAETFPRFWQ